MTSKLEATRIISTLKSINTFKNYKLRIRPTNRLEWEETLYYNLKPDCQCDILKLFKSETQVRSLKINQRHLIYNHLYRSKKTQQKTKTAFKR